MLGRDHYVYGVGWAGPGSLAVVYQNRAQNCSYHAVCSHPHYRCYKVGQWRYNRDRDEGANEMSRNTIYCLETIVQNELPSLTTIATPHIAASFPFFSDHILQIL